MSFYNLLDNTCTIRRGTDVADDIGGASSTTWNILYPNIKCRFENVGRKQEMLVYNKDTVYPDYYVYIESRSGIKEGDRIVFSNRDFEIKLVEDWSEQDRYMRLSVVELTRGE